MAVSADVSAGDTVLASQYNNLRQDASHATLSHKHDGTTDEGILLDFVNIGGIFPIFKDADESVTSSVTLQNDDDFSFSVAANEKWHFRLVLRVSGNGAGDLDIAWSVPSGAAGQWWSIGDLLTNTGLTAPSITTEQRYQITATEQTFVIEGYIIVSSTAGTAQLQWAQGVSNATATIIHEESHMLAWRE